MAEIRNNTRFIRTISRRSLFLGILTPDGDVMMLMRVDALCLDELLVFGYVCGVDADAYCRCLKVLVVAGG